MRKQCNNLGPVPPDPFTNIDSFEQLSEPYNINPFCLLAHGDFSFLSSGACEPPPISHLITTGSWLVSPLRGFFPPPKMPSQWFCSFANGLHHAFYCSAYSENIGNRLIQGIPCALPETVHTDCRVVSLPGGLLEVKG